jgi:hypothetical protein
MFLFEYHVFYSYKYLILLFNQIQYLFNYQLNPIVIYIKLKKKNRILKNLNLI